MSAQQRLRSLFAWGLVFGAASALDACGADAMLSGAAREVDGGAPTLDPTCSRTQDCAANRVCQPSPGESVSRCRVPSGRCSPERVAVDCYPDARCETASGRDGFCSFRPAVRMVFNTTSTIALERPNRESDLSATSGVLLQWTPLRGVSGAVTLAVITDAIPTLDFATGRIQNADRVRWIWSSAEPGGPVMDGTVPLRYGRAGVLRDGRLGAAYGGDTLPAGMYYWFVYAMLRGEVVASSVAQTFRVGLAVPDLRRCTTVSDCFESSADALLFDCITGLCKRRCASDLDCETGRCALEAPPPSGGRRGAFCAAQPVDPADAGVATRTD
jgi:hypothetical protein